MADKGMNTILIDKSVETDQDIGESYKRNKEGDSMAKSVGDESSGASIAEEKQKSGVDYGSLFGIGPLQGGVEEALFVREHGEYLKLMESFMVEEEGLDEGLTEASPEAS
ncbi:hypothetical protein NDU88_001849 [Pleurodeles waltl]|uniref:Uncharacterized protein n=1 Tax=Pleurodeles waltl TaxID=8319 RepID=A0AAV7SBK3_PLEWA|nr:hypothetical protein NDU88_001849 [Pleurodeles waltl]